MIPKTIHYCWFGKKKKPKNVLRYIETWKMNLPSYEIIEWNENNYNYKRIQYAREAYDAQKYAFVSDVCRLEVLFQYGGIYLDTDIEVIKSFDNFLHHTSFIGYESYGIVGTGVIGAQKGEEWIKNLIEQYKTTDFLISDGLLNLRANTQRIDTYLKSIPQEICPKKYPIDYFCAKNWETGEIQITNDTIAVHHYVGSWMNDNRHPYEIAEQSICKKLHIENKHIFIRIYKKILNLIYRR